jgi:drug/metabolite transporter (DMT)-like permease
LREFLLLMAVVVLGTGGELCMTRAMRAIGEISEFRPAALARFMGRAMLVGWMWVGLGMMTVAFFALLAMLSMENVSFVVPVTALNYAVGAAGASLFLGEHVSKRRWIGVAVVCVGVTVVLISKR